MAGHSRLFLLIALSLTLHTTMLLAPPPVLTAGEESRPLLEAFPLPKSLSLCGEPMPLDNPRVREMLDREFTINVWDQAQVFLWLKRGARYFPYIGRRLSEAGMPDDLKYLSVAESSLLTHIRSKEGALGPWQFMSATAKLHGLRVDQMMDERLNFERSTEAALAYLKGLRTLLGSWTSAMAAYNCGDGRLIKDMKEQKVTDYYRLDLPLETERFIFRIAAIKIILQDPRRCGYQMPPEELYTPIPGDKVPIHLGAPIHITNVALGLGTDFKVIKELNPEILGSHLPTGSYTLKVPPGAGPKVAGVLSQQIPSSPPPARASAGESYIVQKGDTLSRVAAKTGIPVETIRRLNGIKDSTIKQGQKLRLAP